MYDECSICNGSGPNIECVDGSLACNASDCLDPSNFIEIFYNSDVDIYGFQFDVNGALVAGTTGGAAEAADFTVSNSETTVIGFSFSGSFIPSGSGVLTKLEVSGNTSDICMSNLVISGQGGVNVEAIVEDCLTISYQINEDVFGCMDEDACNYNAEATIGDDSCEYADDNYNCEGECLV